MARTRGGKPAKRGARGSVRPAPPPPLPHSSEDELSSSSSSRYHRPAHRPQTQVVQDRILEEHIDHEGKLWFSSNWNTRFVFCLAPEYPLRAANTYCEIGEGGAAHAPPEVTDIEIASIGQRKWLVRCPGNQSELWQLLMDRRPSPRPAAAMPDTEPRDETPHPQSTSTVIVQHRPKAPPQALLAVLGSSWRPTTRPADNLSRDSPMLPPPEQSFAHTSDAIAAAKDWAISHGYAISVAGSNPSAGYYYFRCYRGGLLPEERHNTDPSEGGKGKNKAPSRMDAKCPFSLTIAPANGRSAIAIQNPHHTGHSCDPGLFAKAHQHLTAAEQQTVIAMREQDDDIRPMTIRRALNKARQASQPPIPDLVGTKLVSNVLTRAKSKANMTQKSLEDVLVNLGSHSFSNNVTAVPWQNAEGRLVALFVVHKLIHPLLANLPHILVIDTTYSLNRNGYPLVQIGAHMPWGIPIVVACALVEHEDTATYAWILEQYLRLRPNREPPSLVITDADKALSAALRIVMPQVPHILCQWHAAENIEHKGGRHLMPGKGKELRRLWEAVMLADEYDASENRWKYLCDWLKGEEGGLDALEYIESFWRLPVNFERVASCHVNRHRHYGHRVTSEIEGQHRSLKSYLPRISNRRKMNMVEFLSRLEEWLGQRRLQISADLDKERISELWQREDSRLAKVRGVVTKEAMRKGLSTLQEALVTYSSPEGADAVKQAAVAPCTGDLPSCSTDLSDQELWDQPLMHESCPQWSATGVPCKHRLLLAVAAGRRYLLPTDFAPFHLLPETLSYDEPSDSLLEGQQSSIPTAFEDAVGFIQRLEERYPDRVPANHSERLDRAFEAYVCETYTPTGLTQPFQEPLVKAGTTYNEDTHEAASRMLTGNERHNKTQALTLYALSRRCGACGEAGHNISDCPFKGDAYADKRLAWQAEKRAMDRERGKRSRAKRKAERMADLALLAAQEPLAAEDTLDQPLKPAEDVPDGPQLSQMTLDPAEARGDEVQTGQTQSLLLLDAFDGLDTFGEQWNVDMGGLVTENTQDELQIGWAETLARAQTATAPLAIDPDLEGTSKLSVSPPSLQKPAHSPKRPAGTPMSLSETEDLQIEEVVQERGDSEEVIALIDLDLDGKSGKPSSPPKAAAKANKPRRRPRKASGTSRPVIVSSDEATSQSVDDEGFQMLSSQTKLEPRTRSASRRLPDPAQMKGFRPLVDIDPSWRAAKVRSMCSTGNLIRTERTGHCGYDAVAKQVPDLFTSAMDVRRLLFVYIDGKAPQDFPWRTTSHWTAMKHKIFPNGRLPRPEEAELLAAGVKEALWLTDEVLPYLAEALQTPICLMGNGSLSQWCTLLPLTFGNSMTRPIGLWYTNSHWEGVTMKEYGPLPPPTAVWWGQRAASIVGRDDHALLHAKYSFLRWRRAEEGCGCVL